MTTRLDDTLILIRNQIKKYWLSAYPNGWHSEAHKIGRAGPLGYAHRRFLVFLNEGTPAENNAIGHRKMYPEIYPYCFLGLCVVLFAVFCPQRPHREDGVVTHDRGGVRRHRQRLCVANLFRLEAQAA